MGVIGCIEGATAHMKECKEDNGIIYKYPGGSNCDIHKTFMGYALEDLTLLNPEGDSSLNPAYMSTNIIKNIFKSEEEKALFDLWITNRDGSLTDNGRNEWIDYLWEILEGPKKDFIARIIEAYKEEKK